MDRQNQGGLPANLFADTVLIIGCGLMGASLAAGLAQARYPGKVFGYARRPETVAQAKQSGWFDGVSSTLDSWIDQADMVVLCVPLSAFASILKVIQPNLRPNAVITDVGSVKQPVVTAAQQVLAKELFRVVPGHPIAGSEQSGFEAVKPHLYSGRRVILTPLSQTDPEAIARVKSLWEVVRAEVVTLSVEVHDQVLAISSHLPHFLAFAFVEALLAQDVVGIGIDEVARNSAGGLRDFSRIAASEPVMWRDIFFSNRDQMLPVLHQFQQKLKEMEALLTNDNEAGLTAVLRSAQQARAGLEARVKGGGADEEWSDSDGDSPVCE